MIRIVLAAALVLASAGAYAQFNQCGRGFCPGGMFGRGFGSTAVPVPAGEGRILMVDGTSLILQTDGTSAICQHGGC